MAKKILITVGGTGGHLFPAQALAKNLLEHHPDCEVLFVGAKLYSNPFFDHTTFVAKEVSSATFSFKKPLELLIKGGKVAKGIVSSCQIIRSFSPNLVVGFGSFYSLPTLIAAKLCRIPFVLHEQNIIPGRVNRFLSRFATFSSVTFSETRGRLKGVTILTHFPLRFKEANKDVAYASLGLEKGRLTLLIHGGSQGAARINQLIFQAACLLKEALPPFQVIHIVGSKEDEKRSQICWDRLGCPHYIRQFEHQMDLVMSVTDLLIGRAGASFLAEQIASETPGLLIPYPYATDNHQEMNANHFVHEVLGGDFLIEREATPQLLVTKINDIQKTLTQYKENIHRYKQNRNLPHFWELIMQE